MLTDGGLGSRETPFPSPPENGKLMEEYRCFVTKVIKSQILYDSTNRDTKES